MADETKIPDSERADLEYIPRTIFDQAQLDAVLNAYRGPKTGTIKGVGLYFTGLSTGREEIFQENIRIDESLPRKYMINLFREDAEKLLKELTRVLAEQDRWDQEQAIKDSRKPDTPGTE